MRMLRKPELLQKVPLNYKSIWELEKDGKFPSRRLLGPRTVAWVESEVDEWLASRPLAQTSEAERFPRRIRSPSPQNLRLPNKERPDIRKGARP